MTAQQRFTLTRADARRLLVRYHFQPAPLATVIRRLGTIQFDPLAPVGTNPDLVLPARLPEGLPEALQQAARDFLDYLGATRVVLPRGLGREARRAWQRAVP